MSTEENNQGGKKGITGFLTSVQGIITSITALLIAVTSLIVVLKDDGSANDSNNNDPTYEDVTGPNTTQDVVYEDVEDLGIESDMELFVDAQGGDVLVSFQALNGHDCEAYMEFLTGDKPLVSKTNELTIPIDFIPEGEVCTFQAALDVHPMSDNPVYRVIFQFHQDGQLIGTHTINDEHNGSDVVLHDFIAEVLAR